MEIFKKIGSLLLVISLSLYWGIFDGSVDPNVVKYIIYAASVLYGIDILIYINSKINIDEKNDDINV